MCEFAYNQYFFEKEGAVLDSLQLVLIIITFTLIFLIWHVTLQNRFRETVPTKKKKKQYCEFLINFFWRWLSVRL